MIYQIEKKNSLNFIIYLLLLFFFFLYELLMSDFKIN